MYLEGVEGELTALALVWEHASDDMFEHLRRRTAVEWTSGRLGQMTFSEVVQDLKFVSVEVSGLDHTFSSYNDATLTVQ